jgi:hypothetical protein
MVEKKEKGQEERRHVFGVATRIERNCILPYLAVVDVEVVDHRGCGRRLADDDE